MKVFRTGDLLDRAFVAGIVLKGLDGALELVGGVLLLFLSPEAIGSVARALTEHELSEDPNDFFANHVLEATGKLTTGSLRFGAAYLLLHGVVKVVLVGAVLRNRLWAYPWMIAFLLLFIAYQGYRIAVAPSAGLLGLTIFDVAVVLLTWREYEKQRSLKRAQGLVA